MKKVGHHLLGAAVALCTLSWIFISGCGQQIPPTGGPKDSLPPKLVSAQPAYGATGFKGNKIVLVFDEYITLDNPFEKLTYSPLPKTNPVAEGRLKTVTFKIKDTLEENTTYSIDFGDALKDINENNPLKDFSYVFSTGNHIDSAVLTGKVWIAETGKTDSTLIAMLYQQMEDSAVAKEKPRYYARLKGDGSFIFRNIKPGPYKVFALKDADGNKKYDQVSEMIGFLDSAIEIGKDTSVTLYAFVQEDEPKPVTKTTTAKTSTAPKKPEEKRLRFSNNLEGDQQDLLQPLILGTEHPLVNLDNTKIFLTDKDYKKLTTPEIRIDTGRKKIVIDHAWKENTAYRLLLEKDFVLDTMENRFMKSDTIKFTTKRETDYGSIDIRIENLDSSKYPVLILTRENKTSLKQALVNNRYRIKLFTPGEYQISILFDRNNNGKWDTGNYWNHIQPEIVVTRKQVFQIRANWDNELKLDMKEF